MEKTIKSSHRGLSFSFPPIGKFQIGQHYDYIIDRNTSSINIIPSKTGKFTMSRKKSGTKKIPLVDLRNKEVRDLLQTVDQFLLTIGQDCITVTGKAVVKSVAKGRAGGQLIQLVIPQTNILKMASGYSAAHFCAAQLSLDEYLAEQETPIDIPRIHQDLKTVFSVVSLFSGAGILDWSFAQDPQFKLKYAIDYDAAACRTYQQNIGTHIVHGDIHKAFTPNGYPQESLVDDVDVVIGGPSCKPFSNANRHTRLQDHKDSDLVMEYLRIIETLHPKVFAMENVPSVLTACNGEYLHAIQEAAQRLGYQVAVKCIQDKDVGGYTMRRRAFVLGSRVGEASFPTMPTLERARTVRDALSQIDATWSNRNDVSFSGADTVRRMSFVPEGGNYTSIPPEFQTGSKNRHSCTYKRLAQDSQAPTIVNWSKPPLIHPTENRTLSVAEAKALQGLPGNFRLMGGVSAMQQQVGNSVPVAMGTYLKNAVLRALQCNTRACFA